MTCLFHIGELSSAICHLRTAGSQRRGGEMLSVPGDESGSPTGEPSISATMRTFSDKKHVYVLPPSWTGKPDKRDLFCWQYMLIVLFVVCLILFSTWLSIRLCLRHTYRHQGLMPQDSNNRSENFTFDDIFDSSFKPKSYRVQWIHGRDGYVHRNENGTIVYHNATTNSHDVLMEGFILPELKKSKYYVSNDLRYILLAYDIVKVWRHSFFAKYKIYYRNSTRGTGTFIDFPNKDELRGQSLLYAGWSPTGHALSFVYENNLYYQEDPFSHVEQITTTGEPKTIFHGVADWLYEEEILATHVAHWWSEDATYICYATFNDSNVPLFEFPLYGSPDDVYGSTVSIAYPKAGDTRSGHNTKAYLHVISTRAMHAAHTTLPVPEALRHSDHYFTRVTWKNGTHVAVVWTNRPQNRSVTSFCDILSAMCVQNSYMDIKHGWFEPSPQIIFIEGGSSYLRLLSKREKVIGSWQHLALINTTASGNEKVIFLTSGAQEVTTIVGYNEELKLVYYVTTNGDPKKRHLFSVGTSAADSDTRPSRCLSCHLGDSCQYVSATASDSGTYYIVACLGPGVPTYILVDTRRNTSRIVENNDSLRKLLSTKKLPKRKFLQVPIGGGYNAWSEVLLPPEAETDVLGTKYPLLFHTYGGPGSQRVTERFSLGWHTYMANRAIYVSVDGRGTAARGDDFRFLLHRRLATLEVDDQLLAATYFKNTFPFVNSQKSAIWGWSYGGFVSLHAVASQSAVFTCGIAGAPLSNRKYYDTAHTERYMGLYTDNRQGYEKTDVLRKAENFQNRSLLLVHGTADDNVHFASSAQLIRALTKAEIQFRLQIYPDLNHYFVKKNRHLARLFTNFLFDDCWSKQWT